MQLSPLPSSTKAILITISLIKARTNAFLQTTHEQEDPNLCQKAGTPESHVCTRDFKHRLKPLTTNILGAAEGAQLSLRLEPDSPG